MAPVLRALVNSGHGEDLIVRPRKRRVAPLLAGFVAELVPTVRGGRSRRSGGAHPARQARVGAGVQGPMKPIIDRLPRIGISALGNEHHSGSSGFAGHSARRLCEGPKVAGGHSALSKSAKRSGKLGQMRSGR